MLNESIYKKNELYYYLCWFLLFHPCGYIMTLRKKKSNMKIFLNRQTCTNHVVVKRK